MIDYVTIPNISGAFPLVVGLNATTPSALDGTPYLKAVIDDAWGANQALMDKAGLTPDAVTESATASQRLTALYNTTIGPGCVVAWCGDDADPITIGRRMLPLNGQGVLRSTYTELDAVTWVNAGANGTASAFYRADDAAGTIRNIAGIYLILPDYRGCAIRGLDLTGTVDPQGASRDIGNIQDWAIVEHDHYVWDPFGTNYASVEALDWDLTTPDKDAIEMKNGTESTTELRAETMDTAVVPSGNQSADESRMVNAAARWVITY